MSRSRALEVLDLDSESSPQDVEAAYARRLRETDCGRLSGMDPVIVAAAKSQRHRVEVAYQCLTKPDEVAATDLAVLEAAAPLAGPADQGALATKSYMRAIMLTAMMPGAGSWYAGGRLRGLCVMGVICLALVWMMRSAQQVMASAGGGPMAGLRAMPAFLAEMRGPFYGLMFVALADALVAVWAHNDALGEDSEPEQLVE